MRKLKRQSLTARPSPPPSKPLPLTIRQTKKQWKARRRELRALADPALDDPDLLGDLRFIFDNADPYEQARPDPRNRRASNRRDPVADLRDLRRLVLGEDADTAAVTRRPEPPRTSRKRRRDQSPPPEPMTTRSKRGRPRRAAAPRADAFVTTRLPQTSRKKTR